MQKQSGFYWMVSHALREANQVADRIAKMASANMEGVNVLTTVSEEILVVFNSDKASCFFDIINIV
ncbi:hypothetical protein Goari_020044 [Gossypium aridum]|uniref:Uncharacterized protein n=1 Tax=Gossypium aridum TaxID=34290 RepID=A0A7J8WVX9_GOSAI|nr:hypothetical protein [Gossypium aridum]